MDGHGRPGRPDQSRQCLGQWPQDTEDFIRTVKALLESPANPPATPVLPSPVVSAAPADDGTPSWAAEIDSHLADLERRKLNPDTITESRHTLRIFLALTGDIPVKDIKATHVRILGQRADQGRRPKRRRLTSASPGQLDAVLL